MSILKPRPTSIFFVALLVLAVVTAGVYFRRQRSIGTCNSVTVTLPDRTTITAEIANSPALRAKGLSGRTSLAANQGMLFLFPTEGVYPFWMKNTLIPLDIIWIKNGTVVDIVTLPAETQDNIAQHIPTSDADTVLEINKDAAQKHLVTIGSQITWPTCSQ